MKGPMSMTLPKEIKTVGDLRTAVAGYDGQIDVWFNDTGRHLNNLGKGRFEISDTFVEGKSIFNIERLLFVLGLDGLLDGDPVEVTMKSHKVNLIAVGPEGENVDFSFNVEVP
jgi:hypothetical protein